MRIFLHTVNKTLVETLTVRHEISGHNPQFSSGGVGSLIDEEKIWKT